MLAQYSELISMKLEILNETSENFALNLDSREYNSPAKQQDRFCIICPNQKTVHIYYLDFWHEIFNAKTWDWKAC